MLLLYASVTKTIQDFNSTKSSKDINTTKATKKIDRD